MPTLRPHLVIIGRRMSADTNLYDLVLLVDPRAQDADRAKLVADTKAAIEGSGELVRHDEWGVRPLAYPIDRKPEAEYHLLQFKPGNVELIADLDRSLRLSDQALRFLITKVKPGTPDPPAKPDLASRREPEPEAAAA